jgi:hypothetical protein
VDMKEIIRRRQMIEKAFVRGILTQDEFTKKCYELCKSANCDKTTNDACRKDGPCCDVIEH